MNISIIIPVKNEENCIGDLLDSLSEQSVKPDEIIMVDGGSVDNTVRIINHYKANGMPIHLIQLSEALPGKGRNIGIEAARNDIIAMTDGGMIVDRRWLECLVAPFERDSAIEVVYGVCDCYAKTLFEKCFVIVYVAANKKSTSPHTYFPTLQSFALKKYIWEKAGRMPEHLRATEDLIFLNAIEKLRVKSNIAYDAIAHWRPRSSLRETFILAKKYAECDALSSFHILRHIRKWFIYLSGLCFFCMGFIYPGWFAVLLLGFTANTLLVCSKNWDNFINLLRSSPIRVFITISLVITALDIGGMIGFARGVFKKFTIFFTALEDKA